VLVFLSEHSLRSDHVMHEAQIARAKRNHIPILLDPLDIHRLPSGYSVTQSLTVPKKGYTREMWETLDSGIKKAMQSRPWVREIIAQAADTVAAPLHRRLDELEQTNAVYQDKLAELQQQLAKAKSLFQMLDTAINEVQLQGNRLTSDSQEVQDSLTALKEYLTLPKKKLN
jgi:hypothetical protein